MENKKLSKERIENIKDYIKSINEEIFDGFSFGLKDILYDIHRGEGLSDEFNYGDEKEYLDELDGSMGSIAGIFSRKICIDEDKETFSQHLSRLMEEKEITPSDIYNRIFMDRRLFSKIKNNKEYIPRKYNVMALAIALRLNIEESETFLKKAGYSFSDWEKFDLILKFHIEKKIYDLFEINLALDHFQERTIGA